MAFESMLRTPPRFEEVFETVAAKLGECYWLIDTQFGPFSLTDKPNFFELEAELAQYRVKVPALFGTSGGLWRPGIFPKYAGLLVIDEWTYLVGFRGSERDVIRAAEELYEAMDLTSPHFFDLIGAKAEAFLLHVDGWWEVYSSDWDFLEQLRLGQSVSSIQSEKWLSDGRNAST